MSYPLADSIEEAYEQGAGGEAVDMPMWPDARMDFCVAYLIGRMVSLGAPVRAIFEDPDS